MLGLPCGEANAATSGNRSFYGPQPVTFAAAVIARARTAVDIAKRKVR